MKYMGSKNKYWKELLPIILADTTGSETYIEPFMGGANMICRVPVSYTRIGNDNHRFLIELLKHVQSGGELPDYVSEERYKDIQLNKDEYPAWEVGFVGFGCSFGAKWFGGFARNIRKDSPDNHLNMTTRNYCAESKRNLLKQAPLLQGIQFTSQDYKSITIPSGSILYCDPPYKGTTKYKDQFDHDYFYNWLRGLKNCKIFVSEYSMPGDFTCVWQREVVASFDHSSRKTETEKLFTL